MPYGVDVTPFQTLEDRVRSLPEELPSDPTQLEGVLYAYLEAFSCLLSLVMALMRVRVERAKRRRYAAYFLPVYDQAAKRLRVLLEAELREGLQARAPHLVELTHAIRDSQTGLELVVLGRSVTETEKTEDSEDHLDTATTVTNSLKEQIEKHTKRGWIKSVLHVLNEVISIVRGVT